MSTVLLEDRRIVIDGRPQLLRLARADWADRLDRLREYGGDTVATYVPWLWHELPDGSIDLTGRTHEQRDLAGFLDLAHQRGLHAVVRPGPFIMAEVKNEGIPYRVYEQNQHMLPTTWNGAPISTRTIDYLAPEFLAAADAWYAQVMPVIADRLAGRGGPVVAVQVDNEIGMLSWVTNSPDLTDGLCADLARWAVDRYGMDGAPLRYRIGGRVEPVSGPRSDRLSEFDERSGDPRSGRGVDGQFVVSAADVLHERVSGDDHVR